MQAAPRVTEDEYIASERASERKHELINGVVVAMAGASARHNAIVGNIVRALGNALANERCLVFPSDMRVHAQATGLYTYPDVTVACDGLRFHPKFGDTLVNPRVIFEVLSESTEAYDRGAKFAHYQTIASLEEYVLVSQHEAKIEHYRRFGAGQWILTTFTGESAVAALPALGCELPLDQIYAKLDLLPPDDRGGPPAVPAAS
jgi:Uma2 family endonuclease